MAAAWKTAARILFEIIDGVREPLRQDFMLGLRLTPERFGMELAEAIRIAQRVMAEGQVDFLDMSLWDVFKQPEETEYQGRSLMSYFTELDRHKRGSASPARSARRRRRKPPSLRAPTGLCSGARRCCTTISRIATRQTRRSSRCRCR